MSSQQGLAHLRIKSLGRRYWEVEYYAESGVGEYKDIREGEGNLLKECGEGLTMFVGGGHG